MRLHHELGLANPFRDLRHETLLNVVRTANLIAARAAQLFRRFGLTEAQFNALFALKFAGEGITQAELGKRLVVTRASVTSLLDKLESKGLVERIDVPGNRRINHVALTAKGRELVDRVEPVYIGEIHEVLSGMDESECRMLIDFMERARGNVQHLMNEKGIQRPQDAETRPAAS